MRVALRSSEAETMLLTYKHKNVGEKCNCMEVQSELSCACPKSGETLDYIRKGAHHKTNEASSCRCSLLRRNLLHPVPEKVAGFSLSCLPVLNRLSGRSLSQPFATPVAACLDRVAGIPCPSFLPVCGLWHAPHLVLPDFANLGAVMFCFI